MNYFTGVAQLELNEDGPMRSINVVLGDENYKKAATISTFISTSETVFLRGYPVNPYLWEYCRAAILRSLIAFSSVIVLALWIRAAAATISLQR